jgi:hypothetical protein
MAPPEFEKSTLPKAIKEDENATLPNSAAGRRKESSTRAWQTKKSEPTPLPPSTSSKPLPDWPQDSQPLRISPFDRAKNLMSRDPTNIYHLPEAMQILQAQQACWKRMTYGKRRVLMMETLQRPL